MNLRFPANKFHVIQSGLTGTGTYCGKLVGLADTLKAALKLAKRVPAKPGHDIEIIQVDAKGNSGERWEVQS